MSVKVLFKVMPVQIWPEFRVPGEVFEAMDLAVDLLKPASLAAFVLAGWRLGSDIGWTSDFLFVEGILSRWQVWTVLGISMLAAESHLARRHARN